MAKFDLIIRGGSVVTPDGVRSADVAVADGRIVELSPEIIGSASEEIDAKGLHVFPGLIDAHVHFNEPGRTEWEGFATGSAALAAGGGTCFIEMPLNASPPTLDGQSFDAKRAAAEKSSICDFALWGGLTPGNLDRLEELAQRGVVGFKAFMCDSGIADFPRADDLTLCRGMQSAARLGLPVAVHAESQEITLRLAVEAGVRGEVTWMDYVKSRPVLAEIEAIGRAILFARETGCSLHIVHVSSPEGVETVRRGRQEMGVDVTCETCPHYLLLCERDLEMLGARAKCAPPLRSCERRDRMWQCLERGEIDFIASDHSPAPSSMKIGKDPMSAWGGIAGVQSTLLSLQGRDELPPGKISSLVAGRVAQRFRLPDKGQIAVGFDADFALLDLKASKTLQESELLDRHKFSPYVGRTFRGVIRRTVARGATIFDGKHIQPGRKARLITPPSGGGHV